MNMSVTCVTVNFLNFPFNKFSDYLLRLIHEESCQQTFCNAVKNVQNLCILFLDRKLIRVFSTAWQSWHITISTSIRVHSPLAHLPLEPARYQGDCRGNYSSSQVKTEIRILIQLDNILMILSSMTFWGVITIIRSWYNILENLHDKSSLSPSSCLICFHLLPKHLNSRACLHKNHSSGFDNPIIQKSFNTKSRRYYKHL